MPSWEYQIVRADWFTGGLRVIVSGQKAMPLESHLNSLGADGWEVIGVAHAPVVAEIGKIVIILKRPKTSD